MEIENVPMKVDRVVTVSESTMPKFRAYVAITELLTELSEKNKSLESTQNELLSRHQPNHPLHSLQAKERHVNHPHLHHQHQHYYSLKKGYTYRILVTV